MISGRRPQIRKGAKRLASQVFEIINSDPPPRPAKKPFKPKCPELPQLQSYVGSAPKDFWEKFPSNRNIHGKSPFKMNPDRLEELAAEAGVCDQFMVKSVADDIRFGADLKVDGDKCKPNISRNAPSAFKRGREVTDTIAAGVKKKILVGPLETAPTKAVVSGIQAADKDGGVRMIVNQSAPKNRSVNDCLDKKAYPAKMGGTKELLRAINHCGPGALIAKCDWDSGS